MAERLAVYFRLARSLPLMLKSGPAGRFTAADLFEQCVRRNGARTFVRFEGRDVSYDALNAQANRFANWALAEGLGTGDVVALMMENRPAYLAVWLGLAKAGVTTALLNTNVSGAALSHCLREANAARIIAGVECADTLQSLETDLAELPIDYLSDASRATSSTAPSPLLDGPLSQQPSTNPDPAARHKLVAGDPLFYIYTSGTTGLPKAARFSHSRFMGGGSYHLFSGFGRRDVLYCALPLYHTVGGVISVNAVLRTGATLALARKFSASRFWTEIKETGATSFQYIGEVCRYLLNQPEGPDDRAHRVRFAVGNGLRPDIWERFQERFGVPRMVEFYGATESNITLVNLEGRPGSVGRFLPGLQGELIRVDPASEEPVRDADGRCVRCAAGEPGELLGRVSTGKTASGRFEGYTSRKETEKKLLADVFAPGDLWFRSGDLLRRDEAGYFYFVDRMGDTFRWKGENVSTQEVAEVVGLAPGVELCAVYGVAIPGQDGRAGMAAVVIAEGAELDLERLYGLVEQRLPAYARPAFLRVRPGHDMTGTFKIRKVELQNEGFDPATIPDPLYVRDDDHKSYRPLTAEHHARVLAGAARL